MERPGASSPLNGGLQLPDKKITVVHRSDGSGTTFNFVNYLSKVSPTWKSDGRRRHRR